jgi:hypothetical protein
LQPPLLPAVAIEIFRREPLLECLACARPIRVEHRVPGRVSVAALGNHVLAHDAFEIEAIAQGIKRTLIFSIFLAET